MRRDAADIDVDELWLREWAEAGLAALQDYLAKHAAFGDFLQRRGDVDLNSGDDGSSRSV